MNLLRPEEVASKVQVDFHPAHKADMCYAHALHMASVVLATLLRAVRKVSSWKESRYPGVVGRFGRAPDAADEAGGAVGGAAKKENSNRPGGSFAGPPIMNGNIPRLPSHLWLPPFSCRVRLRRRAATRHNDTH